jgi:nucleotidyltransferase substrate binding protein (TIGR01987 family)
MRLDLSNLERVLAALEAAIACADGAAQATMEEGLRDTLNAGLIHDFGLAYEISWKLMKRWLEARLGGISVEGLLRRELFALAGEQRLIDDVALWMRFHDASNLTSYSYDRSLAAEVLARCPAFLAAASKLLEELRRRND